MSRKTRSTATQILERVSKLMESGVITEKPVWFDVVAKNPPRKNFVFYPKHKTSPSGLNETKENGKIYNTRNTKILKNDTAPKKLHFVEDELRELFYSQHPWELSRPKILLENTGEDTLHQNWESIVQLNKPLDGESVVQRTLYLVKNGKQANIVDAYDQARLEFYRVRIQQELEETIAKEENEMFGSAYNKSVIEKGADIEQKFINDWRAKANELAQIMNARN